MKPNQLRPDLFVVRFAQDLEAAGLKRVLDGGCGAGRNAAYLAGLGFQVVALDVAPNKVWEARDKAANNRPIEFLSGRLESLPFSSQSFDALVCTHALEYLNASQISDVLDEFRRVLRKGGLLLLVTAAKEGTDLAEAEALGENDFRFSQGGVEVPVHLAEKAELEGWLMGFRTREMLRLTVEYPKAATVRGSWAVIAQR